MCLTPKEEERLLAITRTKAKQDNPSNGFTIVPTTEELDHFHEDVLETATPVSISLPRSFPPRPHIIPSSEMRGSNPDLDVL